MSRPLRVALVAGEASGDVLGARLIAALRRRRPDLDFAGIGGPRMAEQGVEILTCGTCLDHYGIKDQLAVGEVTNMYVIVEKMEQAVRVVRP